MRYLLLAAMSAVAVMGTGEWTEDAEDLGKFILRYPLQTKI